jgi:hypothetical protein
MYPMICPGNGYIMFRQDGIFLDGREVAVSYYHVSLNRRFDSLFMS